MKVLSIDFGEKRIGLAVGDSALKVAVPKGVIPSGDRAFEEIERIVREGGIKLVVVGLPLTPSGKEGQRAKLVREFVEVLKERLRNIDVELWDERYTTASARERVSHLSPERQKEVIDAVSAQIILEEYLENL